MDRRWTDPSAVLGSVERIAGALRADLLAVLSAEIADLVPHRGALLRTEDCAREPVKTTGDPAAIAAVEPEVLGALAEQVEPGAPAAVTAVGPAGSGRRVAVVSASPAAGRGATLVLVDVGAVPDDAGRVLAALWSAVAALAAERAADTGPGLLTGNLAAATARSRTAADLDRAHRTVLHGILAVLRSRRLPDDQARRDAAELASTAVVASRAGARELRHLAHQPADEAVAALTRELAPVAGHTGLDVVGPAGPAVDLQLDVATTARAVSLGMVLAAVERAGVSRVRCAWTVERGRLRVEVRDDAPDAGGPVLDPDLPERVGALGGWVHSDTTPGWGTIAAAEFPLDAGDPAEPGPMALLHPREREVLAALRDGLRNKEIADRLGLSEHTVKFHVRGILDKLDVRTRGEAAALAHGLEPTGRP